MEVVNTINANITIKSHATDDTKVILVVSGTEYTLDGDDVLRAVNNSMYNN